MRYPYDRYIKSLLLKGYSVATIGDRLRAFKLTPPSEAEMDKIRDLVVGLVIVELKMLGQFLDGLGGRHNAK